MLAKFTATQGPPLDALNNSTTYTRDFLAKADAATALTHLGINSTAQNNALYGRLAAVNTWSTTNTFRSATYWQNASAGAGWLALGSGGASYTGYIEFYQPSANGGARLGIVGYSPTEITLQSEAGGYVFRGAIAPKVGSSDIHHDGRANRSPAFTVSTVPSASTSGAGSQIYVSNETGGAVLAFSDGTNWRRVTDRVIIS
jgi:hypothetical protein